MKTSTVVILVLIIVMNIDAFTLMALDKKQAQKHGWRIRERTLFVVTALFGGLGGCLGMVLLHHKTKHWYFRVFFPILLAIQIVILAVCRRYLF